MHLIKILIGEPPIPTKEGENLHIDLYHAHSVTQSSYKLKKFKRN